uniref:C2H2-type domain-containing protein n=1 Tax=viral metagenome TaxID=1070528 RepID=A0A6C0KDQ8_9ZZZZ
METKKSQKVAKKFVCELCDYYTCKKSDYLKHILTQKHQKYDLETNGNKWKHKSRENIYCDNCNKKYISRSGLWKHMKNCKKEDHTENLTENLTEYKNKEILTDIVLTQQDMITNQTNLINNQQKQIKDFHETLKYMMASTEKREEVLLELAKKPFIMGNNINSNNNINYNIYLNEHCANAIDFPDFLNNINISMEDLFYSKDNGYPKAISNIFQKNLSILDKTERPIHCSDKKRMNFYIKDGKWKKDEDNKKILESIWKVTHKQIKYMDEWKKTNPNWRENEEKDLEFMNIVRNIMGGSTDEEQFKNKNKIIKELAMNNDIKELFAEF